ncbi:hypothetical protein WSK_1286 [Novosphingobium sp. Rr 2-17]|uniref:DUF805 domain-containing protein n=1 Tax=Novosphingobium sp. Rr 2-17 TaxID=555793 RepID=UPI0002697E80|nr:DUF805 domain-containing protein [Novosphingobium sp. Rr 2-17]EIZ80252.1 hypothetical protein WSK_1286 [Novosphingobium sp. Rr 2-17]
MISRSFGRTIAQTLAFSGRARRAEFLVFVVLSQVPIALADWVGGWLAPATIQPWLMFAAHLLTLVPAPALVARRFHDIGLSARWGLILLAVVGLNLSLNLLELIAGWDIRRPVESALSYVDWVLFLPATVLYLALLAMPGRASGVNYGPDPREGEAGTEAGVGGAGAVSARTTPRPG